MDKQALAQSIKDACASDEGDDGASFYEAYSGRAMYDRRCVGVTGTMRECMAAIASVVKSMSAVVTGEALTNGDSYKLSEKEQEFEEAVDTLMGFSQDSMGMGGVILYWPELEPLPAEEHAEDDGQPDEAQEWHDFDPDC